MSDRPDYAHSTWAEQKRTEKAIRLETQLSQDGIPSDAARTLPPAARRRVEKAAGVRVCSDETWTKAIALLEDYENTRRRIAEGNHL